MSRTPEEAVARALLSMGAFVIRYSELGAGKKLNEIVMAGSHDAAITGGGSSAQTQNLDIYGQAVAGVRIFDIRITGAVVKTGNAGSVGALKAYHGVSFGGGTKQVTDLRTGTKGAMDIKPMTLGTYGMALSKILNDAKKFVTENSSEFLILKFDKCQNWNGIAEACLFMLGDRICKIRSNLNTKTLGQLAGQVVVLFSESGQASLGWATHPSVSGILAFQNLKDGGSFNENFAGLQYFGKGGTSVVGGILKTHAEKMKENIRKQAKLMQKGAATNPEVCGMMYWTATGSVTSIKNRNDFMWNESNRIKMMELWATRVPANVDQEAASGSAMLKSFMPNFVMIDFADSEKCKKIYDLNQLAANTMTLAVKKFFDKAA